MTVRTSFFTLPLTSSVYVLGPSVRQLKVKDLALGSKSRFKRGGRQSYEDSSLGSCLLVLGASSRFLNRRGPTPRVLPLISRFTVGVVGRAGAGGSD